jgi:hypothetical protein
VNHVRALQPIAPNASPSEAAAVVAALERFMRDTAPPRAAVEHARDRWTETAVLEGIGREDEAPTAWGSPNPLA